MTDHKENEAIVRAGKSLAIAGVVVAAILALAVIGAIVWNGERSRQVRVDQLGICVSQGFGGWVESKGASVCTGQGRPL